MASLFTNSYENEYVRYSQLTVDRRYEYTSKVTDPIWDKTSSWIEVHEINVETKGICQGTKLLSAFLESIPPNTGVILNASPLDDCPMTFKELQAWYIKRGFTQISKDNISLYHITKE